MKFSWLLLAPLLAISDAAIADVPPVIPAQSVAQDAGEADAVQEPLRELAKAALASYRSNYERLEGVSMTIARQFRDRRISEETIIDKPLPNGGIVREFRQPTSERTERVVVLGEKVRVDLEGGADQPTVTYTFDGERWLELDPRQQRAATMWPNQLGARVLDPREVTAIDGKTTLAKFLSDDVLKTARLDHLGTVSRVTAVLEGGQTMAVDFDAEFGLLPTRCQMFHPNGMLLQNSTVSYSKVEPREAWVIDRIVGYVFPETVDGAKAPDEWIQQLTARVDYSILPRESATEQVVASIPAEFRKVDFTDEATFVAPRPRNVVIQPAETSSPLFWFAVVHAVAIPIVFGVYVWRRRNSPLRV